MEKINKIHVNRFFPVHSLTAVLSVSNHKIAKLNNNNEKKNQRQQHR